MSFPSRSGSASLLSSTEFWRSEEALPPRRVSSAKEQLLVGNGKGLGLGGLLGWHILGCQ